MHTSKTVLSEVKDLPFVGRNEEIKSIATFYWESTAAEGLHLMWLDGEEGIGKSELMIAAAIRVEALGGQVIQIGYYSGMPRPIVSLLANAINSSPDLQKLIAGSVATEFPSLLRGLRKIIRLRPTLLIFEDVHLAGEKEASDLQNLVRSLEHESTGIICTARPLSPPAYYSLKPYLTHSMELGRLNKSALQDLLTTLSVPIESKDPELLLNSTKGHPLMLRSIWPELLRASNEQRRIHPDLIEQLAQKEVSDSVRELTKHFTSSLTQQQKASVHKLTTLGEVFSLEAAECVLGDKEILTTLEEHQIIRKVPFFQRPLLGRQSNYRPLSFAHSLLHQQLLSEAPSTVQQLLTVIRSGTGIYSTLPLQHLSTAPISIDDGFDVAACLSMLVKGLENVEITVLRQQELSTMFWEILQRIIERFTPFLTQEQQRRIRLQSFPLRSRMLYLLPLNAEWRNCVEEYAAATEGPNNVEDAVDRIEAMKHMMLYLDFYKEPVPTSYFDETETLAQRFPDLYSHPYFLPHIGNLSTHAATLGEDYLRRVQQLFNTALQLGAKKSLKHPLYRAGATIAKALATVATTEKEVEELEQLITMIQGDLYDPENHVCFRLFLFNMTAAYLYINPLKCAALIRQHYYATSPGSLLRHVLQIKILQIRLATGSPVPEVEADIHSFLDVLQQLLPKYSTQSLQLDQSLLAQLLYQSSIMIGQIEWGRKTAIAACNNDSTIIAQHLAPDIAMLEGKMTAITRFYREGRPEVSGFRESIMCCVPALNTEGATSTVKAAQELQRYLEVTPASSTALLKIRIAIRFVEEISERTDNPDFRDEMLELIQQALHNSIQWCAEKSLPGYAAPLLDLCKAYLPPAQYKQLSAQISGVHEHTAFINDLKQLSGVQSRDSRLHLRLLGNIEFQKTEGVYERFHGPRIRRTVALIAANHLMRTPLSNIEFRQIATGMDPNSKKFHSYMRTIMWRVRSVLGQDALIVEADTPPRFNTEHIQVDILDAATHLEQCEEAVRKDQPRKAKDALMNALTIIGEGPAYPSLYDDFFEAARLDFEYQLREKILSVVALLLRLKDFGEAVRILRAAQTAMPAEEALTNKLKTTLQLVNKQNETEHAESNNEV